MPGENKPKLNIPPKHFQALEEFIALPVEMQEKLVKALEDTPADLFAGRFVTKLSSSTGISLDSASQVYSALSGMYEARVASGIEVDRFIEDALLALKETARPAFQLSGAPLEQFKAYLKRILNAELSVGITLRAANVRVQHQRVLQQIRILSDLRPIFREEVEGGPSAATIVHTLKITYLEDGAIKSFYAALDEVDLKRLSEATKRALEKDEALKSLIHKSGTSLLEP